MYYEIRCAFVINPYKRVVVLSFVGKTRTPIFQLTNKVMCKKTTKPV